MQINKIFSTIFILLVLSVNSILISPALIFSPNSSTLFMISSEQDAQMLSSVIISSDGAVIVIDGGWTYDSQKLYDILKQYESKVDAWLLTHPDPDHVGALYQLLKDNADLKINTIYCSFADDLWYYSHSPDTAYFVSEFKSLLSNQKTIQVSKGDSFFIGDMQVMVLNNRYDILPNATNNSSIVYKIIIENKSILFLGDLGCEGGERLLAETSPFLLQSDIVQMAHHGQAGVGEEVYRAINPEIALWSTPEWLWTNRNGAGTYKTLETREWMEQIGCKNYVTANGDIHLNLDEMKEE